MAAMAESAVTVETSWTDGGTSSKRHVEMIVTLVLVAMGTVANPIPASALGLTKVERTGSAVLSDNTIVYATSPSYDGSMILIGDVAAGTPVDITGTIRLFVAGYR